jgi:hypothetical protein
MSTEFNIYTYKQTPILIYMYHSYLKLTSQSQILFRSLSSNLAKSKPNPIITRSVLVFFKINYFVHTITKWLVDGYTTTAKRIMFF